MTRTMTAVDVSEPARWAIFRDGEFHEFFDTYEAAEDVAKRALDVIAPMAQTEVDRVLAGINVNHVDDPEDLLSTHKVNYAFSEPKEKKQKRKTKQRKRVGVEFTVAGVKYTRIKDAQAALGVSYHRVKQMIVAENA